MADREKTTKKTTSKAKAKIIRSDDPKSLSESEKEIARKLLRIKNDLQPGNGHSMPKEKFATEIVTYDSDDFNSSQGSWSNLHSE